MRSLGKLTICDFTLQSNVAYVGEFWTLHLWLRVIALYNRENPTSIKKEIWSWRDDPSIKRAYYSYGGPKISSQATSGTVATPVPGILHLLLDCLGTYPHIVHINPNTHACTYI